MLVAHVAHEVIPTAEAFASVATVAHQTLPLSLLCMCCQMTAKVFRVEEGLVAFSARMRTIAMADLLVTSQVAMTVKHGVLSARAVTVTAAEGLRFATLALPASFGRRNLFWRAQPVANSVYVVIPG